MSEFYFNGMHGIGDNIIQRCFIKQLTRKNQNIWLRTPLPEIYQGINGVHFVEAKSLLRTQKKNEKNTTLKFEIAPKGSLWKNISYGDTDLKNGSIITALERQFKIPPANLELPDFIKPDIGSQEDKPLAVIRPTTERAEWHNSSRGPLNRYVDCVARILDGKGWNVVSIADIEPGQEWIPGTEPFAHQKWHHGELSIPQMLALIQHADIVVTGVGVVMLAALAYQRPMICLQGGCGGNNHHYRVTDQSCMDLSQALFVYPDNYCFCQSMTHACNKNISHLPARVMPFIEMVETSIKKETSFEML